MHNIKHFNDSPATVHHYKKLLHEQHKSLIQQQQEAIDKAHKRRHEELQRNMEEHGVESSDELLKVLLHELTGEVYEVKENNNILNWKKDEILALKREKVKEINQEKLEKVKKNLSRYGFHHRIPCRKDKGVYYTLGCEYRLLVAEELDIDIPVEVIKFPKDEDEYLRMQDEIDELYISGIRKKKVGIDKITHHGEREIDSLRLKSVVDNIDKLSDYPLACYVVKGSYDEYFLIGSDYRFFGADKAGLKDVWIVIKGYYSLEEIDEFDLSDLIKLEDEKDDLMIADEGEENKSEDDEYKIVDITKLQKYKGQPRVKLNENTIKIIEENISKVGIKGIDEPLTVIYNSKKDKYEVVDGNHRWTAAINAGLKKIPVIIKSSDDIEILAMRKNIHRTNLHVIEQGRQFKQMLKEGVYTTQVEIAQAYSVSEGHVSECISYADLSDDCIGKTKKQL